MLAKRPLFPGLFAIVLFAMIEPSAAQNIKDRPGQTRAIEVTVQAGIQKELCITLPDGAARTIGSDTYRYYAHRISGQVFAKKPSSPKWQDACSFGNDVMTCSNLAGSGFQYSTFELESTNTYHRHACWTFVNRSHEALNEKFVIHYSLSQVKNGFVLFPGSPDDRMPVATFVQAESVCSSDGQNIIAFFAREVGASSGLYVRRGNVIEIQALGRGQELGIPDDCVSELTAGRYRVVIQHINPFVQPAVYKTVIRGKVTSSNLTGKSATSGSTNTGKRDFTSSR